MDLLRANLSRTRSNLALTVAHAEMTGRRVFRSPIDDLPAGVMSRIGHVDTFSMPKFVMKLRRTDRTDLKKLKKTIANLAQKICEYPATDATKAFSEAFVLFHGVETLLEVLWCKAGRPEGLPLYKTDDEMAHETPATRRAVHVIQGEILAILREISFMNPGIGGFLSSIPGFFDFLFTLVKRPETFDNAVSLIEEIIASGDDVYDLTIIPDVKEMLQRFSAKQLAFFCRLLALICYEPERARDPDRVIKSLELLKSKSAPPSTVKQIVARNCALLMDTPGLLERFLKLCYVGNYPGGTTWTESLQGAFSNPAELLEMLVGEDRDDWEDVVLELAYDLGETPVSLKMLTLATYQVEVVFTLSTLLSGNRKLEAQRRLVDAGLIDVMCRFLDKVTWQAADVDHEKLHGPRCECNPESALKTQFLRLVLNYCECQEASYKRMLLSQEELDYVAALRARSAAPFGKAQAEPDKLIGLRKGVMTKLVHVFIYENPESSFRYWIGSCMEAFLLNGDPEWQLLLAQSGLLSYLIRQILHSADGSATTALQTACDSLAELLKGSREVFSMFNAMLPPSEFQRFMTIILNNLVDSNVFYRALMLSMARFQAAAATSAEPYPFAECQVAKFVASEERSVSVLCSLQESVTVADISQENICVLNSTILFFLLAARQSGGRKSAEDFYELVRLRLEASAKFDKFRTNLMSLLEFWKVYYREREGKEKQNLERSSQIPFQEWDDTVRMISGFLGPADASIVEAFDALKFQ
eukprot:TRINITY_DN18449_c0_g1_i1.p1 TRINITY_DN18449_c0_g1~~TRINITY_DN18449_c0_g1_i1.p1  ORF type:complete len:758 (-),score=252.57 TRINITY_DN18449_c0_g1_i1:347-2620(-)